MILGSPAVVIRPKSALIREVLGLPRFTRLNRLKNSARNSSLCDSANGMTKFLKTEKSTNGSKRTRLRFAKRRGVKPAQNLLSAGAVSRQHGIADYVDAILADSRQ